MAGADAVNDAGPAVAPKDAVSIYIPSRAARS